ncbi:MAG: HAMP domain-containing histidine kinase [Rhodospirillaceae bacterium]|nr:HAMP domain-containing histidine kinase [Rhodospirillaceae bacterium]
MNNPLRIDPTRFLHMAIIFLQVFSVAQIVWWFVDQRSYAEVNAVHVRTLYTSEMVAAQKLAALGVSPADITAIFPHAESVDGQIILKSGVLTDLQDAQQSHVNQYAWESGFFLLVQSLAIAVLWRGLRSEKEIRLKQDNFLAMVSHQFKTPIASLQLSLETMVMREVSAERFQQLSRRMLDDLRRMESMVSKILDSARLDRGRVQLNKEKLNLAEAVRHLLVTLDDLARRENIVFTVDVAPDLVVRADPLAVDGVLRNLVENAMSAMKPKAGGTVTIRGRRSGDDAELQIADTGVGFEPTEGLRLFEKFFRIDDHGGRDAAGTGLGLFIVQRFMHFENGHVSAHSDGPGTGATFTLTWPAATEES